MFGCPKTSFESLKRRQSRSLDVNDNGISRSIRSLPRASVIHLWDSSRESSDSECNVLSHCAVLPKSVLETIGCNLSSVILRTYGFFLLTMNTFHTLSQCYSSNFVKCFVNFFNLIQWYQHTCITMHRFKYLEAFSRLYT